MSGAAAPQLLLLSTPPTRRLSIVGLPYSSCVQTVGGNHLSSVSRVGGNHLASVSRVGDNHNASVSGEGIYNQNTSIERHLWWAFTSRSWSRASAREETHESVRSTASCLWKDQTLRPVAFAVEVKHGAFPTSHRNTELSILY